MREDKIGDAGMESGSLQTGLWLYGAGILALFPIVPQLLNLPAGVF